MPRLSDQQCPEDRYIVEEYGVTMGYTAPWCEPRADFAPIVLTPRGYHMYAAAPEHHGFVTGILEPVMSM